MVLPDLIWVFLILNEIELHFRTISYAKLSIESSNQQLLRIIIVERKEEREDNGMAEKGMEIWKIFDIGSFLNFDQISLIIIERAFVVDWGH